MGRRRIRKLDTLHKHYQKHLMLHSQDKIQRFFQLPLEQQNIQNTPSIIVLTKGQSVYYKT